MLDRLLDVIAIFAPTAIALVSVHIGKKLSQNPQDQSHKNWWYGILFLGILLSVGTLWQQERSRTAHAQEIKTQKDANDRLQSSLDNVKGQMAAFAIVLGQINANDTVSVKEVSEAMKTLSAPKGDKSGTKNAAVRKRLGELLERYYEITKLECSPVMIGAPNSGAAKTQQMCDNIFGQWATEAHQYICESKALEVADCVEFQWARDVNARAEVIRQLIERYRKS